MSQFVRNSHARKIMFERRHLVGSIEASEAIEFQYWLTQWGEDDKDLLIKMHATVGEFTITSEKVHNLSLETSKLLDTVADFQQFFDKQPGAAMQTSSGQIPCDIYREVRLHNLVKLCYSWRSQTGVPAIDPMPG